MTGSGEIGRSSGGTPLHEAVERLDEEAVRRLLAAGADSCAVDEAGESPLSVAIRRKSAILIRLLVEHGALRANYAVRSPFLVRLPETADLELFGYVLDRGKGLLSIEDRDSEGRSALHYALHVGHEKMLFLIVQSGYDLNPLFIMSARRGDYFYVKGSLDHGNGLIRINAVDGKGSSALHYAASNGDARMVRLLLERGADTTLRDAEGRTPAMLSDDPRIGKLLSRAAGSAAASGG